MNVVTYEKSIRKYKICAILSNHTNTFHKYNLSLNNIQHIHRNVDEIIIVDSIHEEYAYQLRESLSFDTKIKKYEFLENDIYFDIGKWCHVLKTTDLSGFDYILFMNDSIMITHTNIDNYFQHLHQYIDSNIYGFNDSTQLEYHYQSYLFFLHRSILHKLIDLFEENKKNIHDYDSLVQNIELKLYKIDNHRKCFIELGVYYNKGLNIFWENEKLYRNLLSKNVFMLIKLKKIYEYHSKYVYPEHTSIPPDFDPDYYRTQYPEFSNQNNDYCASHFYHIGQKEGRKWKKDTSFFLPIHYRVKLTELYMLYLYDVPDDFDVYYYKKWNPDLKDMSPKEIMFHYINHGVYENRKYNITREYNVYFSFYLKYLGGYKCIDLENIVIPPHFSHKHYIKCHPEKKSIDTCHLILEYFQSSNESKKEFFVPDIENSFPARWDMSVYRSFYPFLKEWTEEEIRKDYWNVGVYYNRLYFFPDDFDTEMYKKIYPFLQNKTDEELRAHYIECGFHQNKIYKIPVDFVPVVYQSMYPDLKGVSEDFLIQHYLFCGLHEGRLYKLPNDFDFFIYQSLHSDLQHLNREELTKHFMYYGIHEKRAYRYNTLPFSFNPWIYRDLNPELHSMSHEDELCQHYMTHKDDSSFYVSIDLNYNFDSKTTNPSYIKMTNEKINHTNIIPQIPSPPNPAVSKQEKKEVPYIQSKQAIEPIEFICSAPLLNHSESSFSPSFMSIISAHESEIKAERAEASQKLTCLPDDFSVSEYIRYNPDLNVLGSVSEIEKHYMEKGFSENRMYKKDTVHLSQLPDDFVPREYVRLNPDLDGMDNEYEIEKHYIQYGIPEKRIYKDYSTVPFDFNPFVYQSLHADLSTITSKNELTRHYVEFGKKEHRIYQTHVITQELPRDFNYKIYKTLWNDVIDINEPEKIKQHYLKIGMHEKRIYKLPPDFNYINYKSHNMDLEFDSEEEAINHFIQMGHRENRKYKLSDNDI